MNPVWPKECGTDRALSAVLGWQSGSSSPAPHPSYLPIPCCKPGSQRWDLSCSCWTLSCGAVRRKSKSDSVLDLFLSKLCALLPVLSHNAHFAKECCLEPEIYRRAHLKTLTIKPVLCNKRSHRNEKPVRHNSRLVPTLQLEKACTKQWRPSAVKNKYIYYF